MDHSDPSQLWHLEGSTLKNKLWKSQDEWKFGHDGEMSYLEDATNKKGLGATPCG